jgi:hypothetical protein
MSSITKERVPVKASYVPEMNTTGNTLKHFRNDDSKVEAQLGKVLPPMKQKRQSI